MRKIRSRLIALGLAGLGLLSLGMLQFEPSVKDNEILARVGTQTLTVSDFKNRIKTLAPEFAGVLQTVDGKKRLLDQAVEELLIYEHAKDGEWLKQANVEHEIKSAMQQVLVGLFLQYEVESKLIVDDEEIKKYYEQNKSTYSDVERFHARHILFKTADEAKALYARLNMGADFATLAQENSIGPTAIKGGDLGWFESGQMVPEFEQACRKLKKGQVSAPVKTQFGWHLIKLEDYQAAKPYDLADVREEIRAALKKNKHEKQVQALLADLKNKTTVETHLELLKTIQ